MGFGAGIFLIAVGAILDFAVNPNYRITSWINLGTVGVILMIVGAIGLLLSFLMYGRRRYYGGRDGYVEERPVYRDRQYY